MLLLRSVHSHVLFEVCFLIEGFVAKVTAEGSAMTMN